MSAKKGHGTETVRLDEGEEEESKMMLEAHVGVGREGRNRKRREDRRCHLMDEQKMENQSNQSER